MVSGAACIAWNRGVVKSERYIILLLPNRGLQPMALAQLLTQEKASMGFRPGPVFHPKYIRARMPAAIMGRCTGGPTLKL